MILALERLGQKNQEFKVSLCYIVSLRQAWATKKSENQNQVNLSKYKMHISFIDFMFCTILTMELKGEFPLSTMSLGTSPTMKAASLTLTSC